MIAIKELVKRVRAGEEDPFITPPIEESDAHHQHVGSFKNSTTYSATISQLNPVSKTIRNYQ